MASAELAQSNGIKSLRNASENEVLANHSSAEVYEGSKGEIVGLRHPKWRSNKDSDGVCNEDFLRHPYPFKFLEDPEGVVPKSESAIRARKVLGDIRDGDVSSLCSGVEGEGNLYSSDGGRLISKYDGVNLTPENDSHPELVDSLVEVATGKMDNGRYPSSAHEIAVCWGKEILRAQLYANKRQSIWVMASVPEGGDPSQIAYTDHPYITRMRNEGRRSKTGVPKKTIEIWSQAGADFDYAPISINAMHGHVQNPGKLEDGLFDPRIATAQGLMRLTMFAKLFTLINYNTSDYAGTRFENVKDVRSFLRRSAPEALDATIPAKAHRLFSNMVGEFKSGEIHSFSRYPRSGQRERLRTKEFGTCEWTDNPACPDQRIFLATQYFNQLMDYYTLEAMQASEVNGDESKVIPYLRGRYGKLFEVIPTMQGSNSSFDIDCEFNKRGFDGVVAGKSIASWLERSRGLVRNAGNEASGLETQAKIVDHVIGNALSIPGERTTLSRFMGTDMGKYEPNGKNFGIVADYKGRDSIAGNVLTQAEGVRMQGWALARLRDEKELLEFYGIGDK